MINEVRSSRLDCMAHSFSAVVMVSGAVTDIYLLELENKAMPKLAKISQYRAY